MFGVDLYRWVRFAVFRDGLSWREAALRFGIDRATVAKMLEHSAPPGYRRSAEPRRPKLEAHTGFIDQILFDDLDIPTHRAMVYVHGCFWHRHEGCRYTTVPATRPEFWRAKFDGNVARDSAVRTKLLEDE